VFVAGLVASVWIMALYGFGWELGATVFASTLTFALASYLLGRVSFATPDMLDAGLALELKSRNSKDDFSGD
jgi:hypothetical protein